MKYKFRKKYLLDDIIWGIILFQIFLGNLLGISNAISITLLIFIIISCFQNIKYYLYRGLMSLILFFCVAFVYPLLSFMRDGGNINVLLNNIFYIVTPLSMLLYISGCCNVKVDYLKNKLLQLLPLLNWFAILNIFVMLLQTFLNKRIYSNEIVYKDSISGLFGKYGTPIITIFISCIIVYDYIFLCRKTSKRLRGQLIVIFMTNIIFAAFNDNKAFYLILPLFCCFCIFVKKYEWITKYNTIHNLMKLIVKSCLLLIIFSIISNFVINYTFIGDFFDRIIHEISIGWKKTNLVQGSNERFGMISFALMNSSTRFFGNGLGTCIWKEEYAFGFIHFGQNDIGVFLILGGLLFLFLLLFYIYVVLFQIFKRKVTSIFAVAIMMILGVYTQIFTNMSMMGCTVLYISSCWLMALYERKNY